MPRQRIPHRPPAGTPYEPESLILALNPRAVASELVGYESGSPVRAWTRFGGLRPQQIPVGLNAWMSRDNWRRLATTAGWICVEQRTNIDASYRADAVLYPSTMTRTEIEHIWAECVQFVHEQPFELDLRNAVVFSRLRRGRQAVYINRRGYRVISEGGAFLLGYAYQISADSLRFDDGSRVTIGPDGRVLINTLGPELRQTYARITGLGYDGSGWNNPASLPDRGATPPSPDTLSDALRRDSGPVMDQSNPGSAASMSMAGVEHLRALQRQGRQRWQPDLTALGEVTREPLDALDAAERSGIAEERNSELRVSVLNSELQLRHSAPMRLPEHSVSMWPGDTGPEQFGAYRVQTEREIQHRLHELRAYERRQQEARQAYDALMTLASET